MRRVASATGVLLLLVACTTSAADQGDVKVDADREEACQGAQAPGSTRCEILEGVVARVDVERGHMVVAVDLAWSPRLRTDLGETTLVVSDATLFLPTQHSLAALQPGEDVLVRAAHDGGGSRHAMSVVRVDRG